MPDKNMPGLTFISFGNIAYNTDRGSADLIFERKVCGKCFSRSEEINLARDFAGSHPYFKFFNGFNRSHNESNGHSNKNANKNFHLHPVTCNSKPETWNLSHG
jgi:hypothetical protein